MRELRTFDTGTTAFGMTGITPCSFTGPAPVAENRSVIVPSGGSAAGDVVEPEPPSPAEPLAPTSLYGYFTAAATSARNVPLAE